MLFRLESIVAVCAIALTSSLVSAGGCYPTYSAGSKYGIGSWVSSSISSTTPITYTACSPAGSGTCPASGYKQEGGVTTTATYNFNCISEYWCSQSGYAPTTIYASMAWSQEATACSGSATVAPSKAPIYASLSSVGGCPAAWAAGTPYDTGSRVSVGSLVYECKAWPANQWCDDANYKPDPTKAEGLDYWKQAWEVKGYCEGTMVVTTSPTTASGGGGCPTEWSAGDINKYKEGQRVSVTKTTTPLVKMVYQCKAWPYSGYCGQFSPLNAAGGMLGWDLIGGCSGTITPTGSPTHNPATTVINGCPNEYSSTVTTYKAGDQVSLNKMVYQCREWPNEGWCKQKEYKPAGPYSDMAWTVVGPCDGTMTPTVAPSAFTGACKYIKVVTTTPTPTPVVYDILTWSSGTLYEAGDRVRIGATTYVCKPWPFYFWCRMSAYQPKLTSSGLWTEAWETGGSCEYVSLPPTPVPTSKPTGIPTVTPTSIPTATPTFKPTGVPTETPTSIPTATPTSIPTGVPTS